MLGAELIKKIFESMSNFYLDNHDYYRYGKASYQRNIFIRIGYYIVFRFSKIGIGYWKKNSRYIELSESFNHLQELYESLDDQPSKSLMVSLLTYYVLGKHRVKLPLSNEKYWETLSGLERLIDHKDAVIVENWGQKLFLFDLNRIDHPVKIYFTPKGVLNDFVLKQYEYPVSSGKIIKAESGDYVIDAGGCYGDTGLYFAEQVGSTGKVFVFEFIPSNIKIAKKNFELNERLSNSIQLVEHPAWEINGVPMYYLDKGPGSKVTFEPTNQGKKVLTESIDHLVQSQGISKIDFIKMDIEGAEMPALRGAIETISRFKPKLAISVYHSLSDMCEIPKFIKSIDPAYKLYLGHYTIHYEETILFAVLEK